MTATILLAHGSRDEAWCEPFFELEKSLLESVGETHLIKLAFMELSAPSIKEAVAELTQKGCNQIDIIPLFFAAGRHLKKDVPAMLEKIEQEYLAQNQPIKINLKPPIGQTQAMIDALKSTIEQSIDKDNT